MTMTNGNELNHYRCDSINNTATLALDDLEELSSLESNANISRRSVITDLGAIGSLRSKTYKAT